MADQWEPRKVDHLNTHQYRAPRRSPGAFIARWFPQVRGKGVVFTRTEVVDASKAAWIDTYGEPSYEECRRAWNVLWTDSLNHALRDSCGMLFPGGSKGLYIVDAELADVWVVMNTFAEHARMGRIDIHAAEERVRDLLEKRGVPSETVETLVTAWWQASGF